MKLKQVVAAAAIGCTLGITGISMTSGIASADQCQPAPGVQCGGGPGGVLLLNEDPGRNTARRNKARRTRRRPQQGGPPPGGPQPGGPQQGGPPPPPPPPDFRRPGGPGGPPPPPGGPGGPGGPVIRTPDNHDWRPPWNPGDNDWRGRFQGAPWGGDLPPWGWGAPPPPPWDGPLPEAWGPPPPPINYWGFQEQPIWDPGFQPVGFLLLRDLDSAPDLTPRRDGRLVYGAAVLAGQFT